MTPVSPGSLVLHKAAALATSVLALAVVLLAAMAVSGWAFDMHLALADVASGAVSMALLGVEFGWLALGIGAATGRRVAAISVSTASAVAAYVLYVAGMLVDAVGSWQELSPFQQALAGGPLGAGLHGDWLRMVLAALVFVAAALPVFNRRDITSR